MAGRPAASAASQVRRRPVYDIEVDDDLPTSAGVSLLLQWVIALGDCALAKPPSHGSARTISLAWY